MQETQFEYAGHIVDISVREAPAESSTGVYLTTITLTPLRADGGQGEAIILAKNSQGIFMDATAACEAAAAKTRTYLDRLHGGQ